MSSFLSLRQPRKKTSSTSLAQSLKCSRSRIVQSPATSESYCSLQPVSAAAAFTLRITEQMGFRKFISKVEIFDGCYNERICGYTGIRMTLLKALTFKCGRSRLAGRNLDFTVACRSHHRLPWGRWCVGAEGMKDIKFIQQTVPFPFSKVSSLTAVKCINANTDESCLNQTPQDAYCIRSTEIPQQNFS